MTTRATATNPSSPVVNSQFGVDRYELNMDFTFLKGGYKKMCESKIQTETQNSVLNAICDGKSKITMNFVDPASQITKATISSLDVKLKSLFSANGRVDSRFSSGGVKLIPESSQKQTQVPQTLWEQNWKNKLLDYRLENHDGIPKIEMPVFNGTYPFIWIVKVERFFKIGKYGDEEKLGLVCLCLEGKVRRWFYWELRRKGFSNWNDFNYRLLVRFGPVKNDSPSEVHLNDESISSRGAVHEAEIMLTTDSIPKIAQKAHSTSEAELIPQHVAPQIAELPHSLEVTTICVPQPQPTEHSIFEDSVDASQIGGNETIPVVKPLESSNMDESSEKSGSSQDNNAILVTESIPSQHDDHQKKSILTSESLEKEISCSTIEDIHDMESCCRNKSIEDGLIQEEESSSEKEVNSDPVLLQFEEFPQSQVIASHSEPSLRFCSASWDVFEELMSATMRNTHVQYQYDLDCVNAYQVFDVMPSFKNRKLQLLKKQRFPKSWNFKFKNRKLQKCKSPIALHQNVKYWQWRRQPHISRLICKVRLCHHSKGLKQFKYGDKVLQSMDEQIIEGKMEMAHPVLLLFKRGTIMGIELQSIPKDSLYFSVWHCWRKKKLQTIRVQQWLLLTSLHLVLELSEVIWQWLCFNETLVYSQLQSAYDIGVFQLGFQIIVSNNMKELQPLGSSHGSSSIFLLSSSLRSSLFSREGVYKRIHTGLLIVDVLNWLFSTASECDVLKRNVGKQRDKREKKRLITHLLQILIQQEKIWKKLYKSRMFKYKRRVNGYKSCSAIIGSKMQSSILIQSLGKEEMLTSISVAVTEKTAFLVASEISDTIADSWSEWQLSELYLESDHFSFFTSSLRASLFSMGKVLIRVELEADVDKCEEKVKSRSISNRVCS